jgi:calcium/calmodulin-dependent protein kinase (CaM kinase) II
MTDPLTAELLELNQRLLDSVARADWDTYQDLCDATLTAFEPEAIGHLVEGMAFHRFYFERGPASTHHNTTMSSPHVRAMGDVAVVAYVRLIQRVTANGSTVTVGSEETRIWQRQQGRWKHVHFHRSALA